MNRTIWIATMILTTTAITVDINAAERFLNNEDGTVSDSVTGLMWQREDDDATRTWMNALAYCENLSLGGHTNWRLPNIKELRSIVDNTVYNPSINSTMFPNTNSNYYWSSTASPNTDYAFDVNFNSGFTGGDSRINALYVRCVR